MSGLSIAITGDGQLFQVWLSHAMNRFPTATFYDRSAATTAVRQGEVTLGKKGFLDAAGQASAQRTAQNLANPPEVDATVTFSGPVQNGTVKVTCRNGAEKVVQVRLHALDDDAIRQAFYHVDDAITRCAISPAMV